MKSYYFDMIKINSEEDDLQIPIHAYPVLNRENLREIFPRLIDFGNVEIGDQEYRVYIKIFKVYFYIFEIEIPINL